MLKTQSELMSSCYHVAYESLIKGINYLFYSTDDCLFVKRFKFRFIADQIRKKSIITKLCLDYLIEAVFSRLTS